MAQIQVSTKPSIQFSSRSLSTKAAIRCDAEKMTDWAQSGPSLRSSRRSGLTGCSAEWLTTRERQALLD